MSDFITITVQNKYADRWKNSVRVNPTPKHRALLQGIAEKNGVRNAGEALRYVLQDYFDKMPENERLNLLARSKNHY